MKKKTIPTKPFQYNFKIWNTSEDVCVYIGSTPKEVYDEYRYFYGDWIYKEVSIPRNRYYYDSAAPKTRLVRDYRMYIILDHFGDQIPFDDLHEKYRKPYKAYQYPCNCDNVPDVRYVKGNPNKIKRGYGISNAWWCESINPYESAYITDYYHRSFSTTPEHRRNAADIADYGEELVRGRRRKCNLPTSWDDKMNMASRQATSWKTHSKRRKQWKPKS